MQNDPSLTSDALAEEQPLPAHQSEHIARVVLGVFLLTFICSRVLVILIMTREIPDLFLHLGHNQTHVHHLNYGIFLLSGVGAYLLFRRPGGAHLTFAAIVYGTGLALTFDEFGMWLHLGGSYWQRASFDAIVVIAAVLGLIAYAPSIKNFHPRHWFWTIVLTIAVLIFTIMLAISLKDRIAVIGSFLHKIESGGPQ